MSRPWWEDWTAPTKADLDALQAASDDTSSKVGVLRQAVTDVGVIVPFPVELDVTVPAEWVPPDFLSTMEELIVEAAVTSETPHDKHCAVWFLQLIKPLIHKAAYVATLPDSAFE